MSCFTTYQVASKLFLSTLPFWKWSSSLASGPLPRVECGDMQSSLMGHARRDRGRVTPANALVVIKWNGSRVVGEPEVAVRIGFLGITSA